MARCRSLACSSADQRHIAQRGGRQGGEGADGRILYVVERVLVERVQGQYADQLAVDMQAAAQTGMHARVALRIGSHQAVEWVGQLAVGREAHRVVGAENGRQARVRRRIEAPSHQVGRQTGTGHWHQRAFLQMHQRNRIARQHRADR